MQAMAPSGSCAPQAGHSVVVAAVPFVSPEGFAPRSGPLGGRCGGGVGGGGGGAGGAGRVATAAPAPLPPTAALAAAAGAAAGGRGAAGAVNGFWQVGQRNCL